MRREPTQAENKLWLLLRNRRFVDYKFRRQVPVGPYIADFACYSAKLIVEADGGPHAESTRDLDRDAELYRRGFRLLRLWNNDILARPGLVLDALWHALTTPSSDPAGRFLPQEQKRCSTAPASALSPLTVDGIASGSQKVGPRLDPRVGEVNIQPQGARQ